MSGSVTPDVAGLLRAWNPAIAIQSLELLGEGDFCVAYLLNGHEVIRVPRHDEAMHALQLEACLLPRLAPHLPAPVPRPAFVMRFSIHELVPGVQLADDGWRQLPAGTRSAIACAIGRFLNALHEIDPSVASSCQMRWFDHHAHARSLRERIETAGEPASMHAGLTAALDRYLTNAAEWVYEPAILHADISPEHVLIDPDRGQITGVIDWGDLGIGDPARDFIFLYEDWDLDFLTRALDAYERESRERMQPRVMMLYLMDQLDWTLLAAEQGRRADCADGVKALERAMRDFDGIDGARA